MGFLKRVVSGIDLLSKDGENFDLSTVRCDPGTYFNATYGFCLPCPKGTYQSDADSLYCAPCPASYSTVIGASRLQDCAGKGLILTSLEFVWYTLGFWRRSMRSRSLQRHRHGPVFRVPERNVPAG